MPHNYKKMPELWRIKEFFKLSDQYPSGLEWAINKARHKKGDPAGRLNRSNSYYFVSIDNEEYMAHRIVYYLKTNICPDNYCIKHSFYNKEKDNRLELKPTYSSTKHKKNISYV